MLSNDGTLPEQTTGRRSTLPDVDLAILTTGRALPCTQSNTTEPSMYPAGSCHRSARRESLALTVGFFAVSSMPTDGFRLQSNTRRTSMFPDELSAQSNTGRASMLPDGFLAQSNTRRASMSPGGFLAQSNARRTAMLPHGFSAQRATRRTSMPHTGFSLKSNSRLTPLSDALSPQAITNGADSHVDGLGAQTIAGDASTLPDDGLAQTTTGETSPAPDGGWGWIVTFSSFMITVIIDGICLSFGVFLSDFLNQFGRSQSKTQTLNSVLLGTFLTLGPLTSALVTKFGYRKVVMCGSILSCAGIFLSTFSQSLDVMILLYSGVGGLGFSLMYLPANVIVGHYFDRHRALVCGITTCGTGISGLIFPSLGVYLLDEYGWRGTLWIYSGIVLNGVVFGALYRQLPSMSAKPMDKKSAILNTKEFHTATPEQRHLPWWEVVSEFVKENFDIYLLTSPTFMVYVISFFLALAGFLIPFNFLPALAGDLGLSATDGAMLVSMIGITNTVFRILIGFLSDQSWSDAVLINSLALLIGGAATFFLPYYQMYGILAAYSFVFGITIAALICLKPVLIVELIGLDKLNRGFGIHGMLTGVALFIGSPIAGALVDTAGSYHVTFYYSGVLLFAAGLMSLPLRRISKWEHDRNTKTDDVTDTPVCISTENINTYM